MDCRCLICILTMTVIAAAASCSKTRPAYNRENLKGTWVADVYDGSTADPSKWTVQTFGDDNSTLTVYGTQDIGDGNREWGKCGLSYQAYCCDVSYSGFIKGFFGIPVSALLVREYAFVSSEDSSVTLEITSEKLNSEDVYSDHNRLTMRKLPKDYTACDSLVGIWQTLTRDGEKFESWRLMFESDGRFTMSVRSDSGIWHYLGDGSDIYYPYQDFIALTVTDNPYLGTEGFTDVAYMTELTAMPETSYMSFTSDGHEYIMTYISSL